MSLRITYSAGPAKKGREAAEVKVHLPVALRTYTQHRARVLVQASTVADLIQKLDRQFPGIGDRICDESGRVRPLVNFFVNERSIVGSSGLATRLKPGDSIYVIPSIAGGAFS